MLPFIFAVPILISKGVIKQVLPLHHSEDLTYLKKNWVQAFLSKQPLGEYRKCAPSTVTKEFDWAVRACSLYSTVEDSSDELKMGPTRKKN